ncbi:hypothetical protein [Mycobacterium szulgai]|uniref:GIY-YIG domain-containing protein n=1 Tax=Mycobacterium szulgai TaxID=1787 RepID=A0A1X2DKQ2_MYCSZ|nr:hypothetical protein [Mycobacterium szulgai]MCV7076985.1 hypothetical protein [Mycobacterium szulgai]ORW88795.1 hypothetical protein AWC27_13935 [Mycobacterium szulgai]
MIVGGEFNAPNVIRATIYPLNEKYFRPLDGDDYDVDAAAGAFEVRGYFVYVLWSDDDDDRPLYVGQTTDVFSRMAWHLRDPRKRDRIDRVKVIRCTNRRAMLHLEKRLIRELHPLLNVHMAISAPTEGG